jgi:hypothetical protein
MTDPYPPTAAPGAAPTGAAPAVEQPRRPSPLWQTLVICFVGLTVSGALVALSLFSRNLFVPLVLAATVIAVAVGLYAAVQGWKGSQRAAARGAQGRAAAIAFASGAMLIVSAVAISGAIWIVLLFFF